MVFAWKIWLKWMQVSIAERLNSKAAAEEDVKFWQMANISLVLITSADQECCISTGTSVCHQRIWFSFENLCPGLMKFFFTLVVLVGFWWVGFRWLFCCWAHDPALYLQKCFLHPFGNELWFSFHSVYSSLLSFAVFFFQETLNLVLLRSESQWNWKDIEKLSCWVSLTSAELTSAVL